MSDNRDNNKMKELALIFALTVATGYFGINGFPILLMVFPSFSVVIGVKYGLKYNLINMGLSSAALSLLGGLGYMPVFTIYFGLSAIMNLGIKKREKLSRILLKSGTYMFLSMGLIVVVLKIYFGLDIAQALKEAMETGLKETLEQLETVGGDYDLVSIKSIMNESIAFIVNIFPALLAIGGFMVSTISYGVSSYIIRKNSIGWAEPLRLRDFRLSTSFSIASLGILVAVLLMKLIGLSVYGLLVENLTFILYILVFIQGLGVVSHFLNKKKVSKFLQWLIIGFLLFSPGIVMVVSFIGVADIVFNFRKVRS